MSDLDRDDGLDLDTDHTLMPELAELCRIHDVGLELIESSHDLDALLARIMDEYEARLAELPSDVFDADTETLGEDGSRKLRALVMFASHAAALKAKAEAATELRRRAEDVERTNARLVAALEEVESAHRRLDAVLSVLDAGIAIVDERGKVERANAAAARIVGRETRELDGRPVDELVGEVPRGGDGEVKIEPAEAAQRVVTVARRDLEPGDPGEVVLLNDVTERDRRMERRHRLERLTEVFKTLGVLSHKINNPLTALLGRAQILNRLSDEDTKEGKAASVIIDSSKRIADLVREVALVTKEGRQEALDEMLSLDGPGLDPNGSKGGEKR